MSRLASRSALGDPLGRGGDWRGDRGHEEDREQARDGQVDAGVTLASRGSSGLPHGAMQRWASVCPGVVLSWGSRPGTGLGLPRHRRPPGRTMTGAGYRLAATPVTSRQAARAVAVSGSDDALFDDVEALSFDCYGTLIDWESGIHAAAGPAFFAPMA